MTTKTHVRKLTYQNVVPVLIALHTETMPCNVAVIAIAIAITNLIVITPMSKRMHQSASLDIYICNTVAPILQRLIYLRGICRSPGINNLCIPAGGRVGFN